MREGDRCWEPFYGSRLFFSCLSSLRFLFLSCFSSSKSRRRSGSESGTISSSSMVYDGDARTEGDGHAGEVRASGSGGCERGRARDRVRPIVEEARASAVRTHRSPDGWA